MKFFDLHCDVLDACRENGKGFKNNGFQLDLDKIDFIDDFYVCTALYTANNNLTELNFRVNKMMNILKEQKNLHENEKVHFVATVENSAFLGENIENVNFLIENNIKMASLTWNKDNQLGSGVGGTNFGLSNFGKKVLKKYIENNIKIDVSHASEKLFWDICEETKTSIVASHSNAKKICNHDRNLTDEQIKEVINRKGLIGLNFYKAFLNNVENKAGIDDIIYHSDYMLSYGAENNLAIGSDFDGCDLPIGVVGIESIYDIYNRFLQKNYSQNLTDKIFFENAYKFFGKLN